MDGEEYIAMKRIAKWRRVRREGETDDGRGIRSLGVKTGKKCQSEHKLNITCHDDHNGLNLDAGCQCEGVTILKTFARLLPISGRNLQPQ